MASSDTNVLALLEGTLDDLKDLPEIRAWPAGLHKANAHLEKFWDDEKKKTKLRGFILKGKAIETVELLDSEDTPLVKDENLSILYLLETEVGQGVFKKMMSGVSEALGGGSIGQLVEAWKEDREIQVLCKKPRKDKNDADRFYTQVEEVMMS